MTTTTDQATTAEQVPTDRAGLFDFLRKLTPWEQSDVTDRLAVQLGGSPEAIERACALVDVSLQDIAQDNAIDRERANLAQHLAAAAQSLQAADGSLTHLCGDLYDVEYAEGGQRVLDLRVFLDDAARMLRAAAALNPCPPAKNGTAQ